MGISDLLQKSNAANSLVFILLTEDLAAVSHSCRTLEGLIVQVCWGGHVAREGVIVECPLNGQFHDRRDVILTSQMAVSNNFLTVTDI